jgi:PHD/YefM family antitoxin component YafN of YafNO toxin-antitoxin module
MGGDGAMEKSAKRVSCEDARKSLDILIDEITRAHEPVYIEGNNRKTVVMMDVRDFERLRRRELPEHGKGFSDKKDSSVKELFGLLRHRAPKTPATLEEMEEAIRKRRIERALK